MIVIDTTPKNDFSKEQYKTQEVQKNSGKTTHTASIRLEESKSMSRMKEESKKPFTDPNALLRKMDTKKTSAIPTP